MRGIGHGQRVLVMLPPAVHQLLRLETSKALHVHHAERDALLAKMGPVQQRAALLSDLCGWLILSGIRTISRHLPTY